MDWLKDFFDIFLHIGDKLKEVVATYQGWTYLILFAIIFCETGLVITPFLPGDSLLFAAGTLIAGSDSGGMNVWILILVLFIAAFLGDTVNYFVGRKLGLRVLSWKFRGRKLVNQKYIDRTHEFFEKHGPKTIIIARFVPIVRTFAPFVAGIGNMNYSKFISYNIIGGAIWVPALTLLGYYFGNIPVVQKNFELAILAIIVISVLPVIFELLRNRKNQTPA